ncbi:MAG: AraC family transcriptional regulator ligand-binding domain-containing protein [Pseudomonadota bacterium]
MSGIRSGTATPLVSFALSRGLTMSEIETAAGVSFRELMAPDLRLPDRVMPNIWLCLLERFPDEPLTLEMARAAPFSFFGGLAEGAQFADDLDTALKLMVDNAAIISDRIDLRFEKTDHDAHLTAHHPLDALDGGCMAETGTALATRMIREFFGIEDALMRVTLAHAPNFHPSHYREFYGVPVEFEAAQTALVISLKRLDAPVKHANAALFGYVQTHFAALQNEIYAQDGSPEIVQPEVLQLRRAAAENANVGVFGTAAVAAAANMSLRHAQRVSAAEGQTLQGIIDTVREARAKVFLSDLRLDVNSIALLLGYSDERAFRRAFQRWTGQAPSEFRNALKAGQE